MGQRPLAGWAAGGAVTQLLANGLACLVWAGVKWHWLGLEWGEVVSTGQLRVGGMLRRRWSVLSHRRDIASVQGVHPLPWAGIPLYSGSDLSEAWALTVCQAEDWGFRRCAGGWSGDAR